jgi:hypothetical protein
MHASCDASITTESLCGAYEAKQIVVLASGCVGADMLTVAYMTVSLD